MINLLAVDGPERLVIVVVWLVESSNPQQFVTRSELEVHERKKIFGEYLFIREFMKTCSSGDQLAHEVDSERGGWFQQLWPVHATAGVGFSRL
jgi:predicted RNA-binding protein with EMAP domain